MPPTAKIYDSLGPTSGPSTSAITFGSRENMPPGAVIMSRDAALKHQLELFSKWKPKRDVWPIIHGATISGTAAGFSGTVLNIIFRKHYALRTLAQISTTVPNALLPGAVAYLTSSFIMHDIVLMDIQCVVCTQTRAMAYQVGFGAIYPCIMAPLSCLTIAARSLTYPVPPFRTHYKDILADIHRVFKKHRITLAVLAAFQFVVSFGIVHMQMQTVFKVQRKLEER